MKSPGSLGLFYFILLTGYTDFHGYNANEKNLCLSVKFVRKTIKWMVKHCPMQADF